MLHIGDVRDILPTLPDESVNCIVTSPPYWGLRDYGVEGQIGLERTPEEYIEAMVSVFRKLRRVLRKDGTCWVNIGDCYAAAPPGTKRGVSEASTLHGVMSEKYKQTLDQSVGTKRNTVAGGLKPKDLAMIPARIALALQADGWWVRSHIIWAKRSPMPESVTDRPTSAHESIFLLTKSARYWYDAEAVRQPDCGHRSGNNFVKPERLKWGERGNQEQWTPGNGSNLRNVWHLGPEPYPEAHFATFPSEIPRRAILAGCPAFVCSNCGVPLKSIWLKQATWGSACGCADKAAIPGVVLDPFMGSGTTAMVAQELGRKWIGIELNPEYAKMVDKRAQQYGMAL